MGKTEYEIKDFTTDVIQRSQSIPVLVDFWAPWCGPCKVLSPVLERLAEKHKDEWVLAKVNTDVHQEVAARYGIRGIPNVKLFVDGKVVNEFTGALPEPMVIQWLKKSLPSRFGKDVERAERLIEQHNIVEGQKILGDILKDDPHNHAAQTVLAGTYLYSDPGRAIALVRDIEEHLSEHPTAESIRTIGRLLLHLGEPEKLPEGSVKQLYLDAARELSLQNYDAALEKFIEVLKTDRSYDDDGARKACLAIFRMLGDEHLTAMKYRRAFSSALYS